MLLSNSWLRYLKPSLAKCLNSYLMKNLEIAIYTKAHTFFQSIWYEIYFKIEFA